jgi:hypothetical protein
MRPWYDGLSNHALPVSKAFGIAILQIESAIVNRSFQSIFLKIYHLKM